MSNTLLTKVKSKLFIASRKKALHILEGEFKSLSFGRSVDFEDLREYQQGDEIKDIDWKATARSDKTLVRRYISSKRHNVMFVVDTGINSRAVTDSLEPKYQISILVAGILGYLSIKHSDNVCAILGDENQTRVVGAKSTEAHLERILEAVQTLSMQPDSARSDIMHQLNLVADSYRSRMILVVVADDFTPTADNLVTLRMLASKHDVLWISVSDADPFKLAQQNVKSFDVQDGYEVPEFVIRNKELSQNFYESENERKDQMRFALDGLGIPHVEMDGSDAVISRLIALLERRKRGLRQHRASRAV